MAAIRDRLITILLASNALAFPAAAAGTRPQVDLSLEVTTTPVPFVPGGHGIVTMTVHNAGPDTAGATVPGQNTIDVAEDWFDITTQAPAFAIPVQGVGCIVDTFISEPLPDGHIGLVYIFYFDQIAAGESRVCTYGVDFDPSSRDSFATGWYVSTSNEDDTDPTNNRVDYLFRAPPASIPAVSWQGLTSLGFGVLVCSWIWRRRMSRPERLGR